MPCCARTKRFHVSWSHHPHPPVTSRRVRLPTEPSIRSTNISNLPPHLNRIFFKEKKKDKTRLRDFLHFSLKDSIFISTFNFNASVKHCYFLRSCWNFTRCSSRHSDLQAGTCCNHKGALTYTHQHYHTHTHTTIRALMVRHTRTHTHTILQFFMLNIPSIQNSYLRLQNF